MRVFIIGANGQIGQHLVTQLQESTEHTPIAMVRKQEQVTQFDEKGVETQLVDLEGSIDSIYKAITNVKADAVVFTAGSGAHTGADKTMLIDLDGAIKSMEAAKLAEVNRFVIVSAIGAHKYHDIESDKASYYRAAKYYADVWLENSGLLYTIIRPGGLTNSSGNRQIKIGRTLDFADIPREDVAATIIASLENRKTIGKAFDLVGGNKQIDEALNEL